MTIAEAIYFIVGLLLGGLGFWLGNQTWNSYKKARGSLQAREKAFSEREKQKQKAREETVKGRRMFLRSLWFLLLTLLFASLVIGALTLLAML